MFRRKCSYSLKTVLFTVGRFVFLFLFVQCKYNIKFGYDSAYNKFNLRRLFVMSFVCACILCCSQIWVASICLFDDKSMRTIVPNALHVRTSAELIRGCRQFEVARGLNLRVESRCQSGAPFSSTRREGGFCRNRQLCCYRHH